MTPRVIEPTLLERVLPADDFTTLQAKLRAMRAGGLDHQTESGRWVLHSSQSELLVDHHERLAGLARHVFGSPTLRPSHSLFAHYEGPRATLARHRDTNACEYTLDLCLYQRTGWDLWVVDQPYTLRENEALAFCGTVQEHWRGRLPEPETNQVGMVFFHFVEPDHWFSTIGPGWENKLGVLERAGARMVDPEHGVLMALMVAARNSADLYRRVSERFGEPHPIDRVFAWIGALCGKTADPGLLGLRLSAPALGLARGLAEGRPFDVIAAELNASRRVPLAVSELRRAEAELRDSVLAILFS
jgi:hypothetical protein